MTVLNMQTYIKITHIKIILYFIESNMDNKSLLHMEGFSNRQLISSDKHFLCLYFSATHQLPYRPYFSFFIFYVFLLSQHLEIPLKYIFFLLNLLSFYEFFLFFPTFHYFSVFSISWFLTFFMFIPSFFSIYTFLWLLVFLNFLFLRLCVSITFSSVPCLPVSCSRQNILPIFSSDYYPNALIEILFLHKPCILTS